MYFPILSGIPGQASAATIVVRTAGDPLPLSIPIQQQVAALDPALPVYDILTMQQILGKSTATQSFSATLVLAFATLSLLLAAIGLYGVLSYLVAQRNTEIGIRMALGAQRAEVLRLVLFDGLRPVFFGLVARFGGRCYGSFIHSLDFVWNQPARPGCAFGHGGVSLLTAVIACVLPAIRASKIEPMQALRIRVILGVTWIILCCYQTKIPQGRLKVFRIASPRNFIRPFGTGRPFTFNPGLASWAKFSQTCPN